MYRKEAICSDFYSMSDKIPIHGHRYDITLFYRTESFPAVFYLAYTDLFGNSYCHLFMDDSGRIFEIADVQKWE
jgi:hypothetical protein